jgi:hypothetical protein
MPRECRAGGRAVPIVDGDLPTVQANIEAPDAFPPFSLRVPPKSDDRRQTLIRNLDGRREAKIAIHLDVWPLDVNRRYIVFLCLNDQGA